MATSNVIQFAAYLDNSPIMVIYPFYITKEQFSDAKNIFGG